jgi:hypothetical protein
MKELIGFVKRIFYCVTGATGSTGTTGATGTAGSGWIGLST